MKTLGILGGVGPQTTAEVYLSVIQSVKSGGADGYPPIVIYNLPFPFAIEDEAIVQGINSEKMIPYLVEGAKTLEKAGADFGILPCNTLHKYIGEIRDSVKIPFLSILEETALFLKKAGLKKVGLLATETTVKSRLYDSILESNGISVIYPDDGEQRDINHLIISLLNAGQADSMISRLEAICASLKDKGADAILLGCTDLQLIAKDTNIKIPVIDSTQILIDASTREIKRG